MVQQIEAQPPTDSPNGRLTAILTEMENSNLTAEKLVGAIMKIIENLEGPMEPIDPEKQIYEKTENTLDKLDREIWRFQDHNRWLERILSRMQKIN